MTAADLCLVVIWNSWVGLENVNSGFTITGWTSHPVSNMFVFVKNFTFTFIWLEIYHWLLLQPVPREPQRCLNKLRSIP